MKTERGCHLCCTACRLVLLSYLTLSRWRPLSYRNQSIFNDHILFQEYTRFKLFVYSTLDSQVLLSSCMSIKTGLFSFLTLCIIGILIFGILDHYGIMENLKKI